MISVFWCIWCLVFGTGFSSGKFHKLETVSTFDGVFDETKYKNYDSLEFATIANSINSITLSTVTVDSATGEQWVESLSENEIISPWFSRLSSLMSNDDEISGTLGQSTLTGEYFTSTTSTNGNIHGARRMATNVLGSSDSREEELGNPPTTGVNRWVVCISIGTCDCCCSGVMIDHRWVLTAGHCIHEGGEEENGWFSDITVYPARTVNYTPLSIAARRLVVWTEWFENDNDFYDQGWIELVSNGLVGHAGWGWNTGLSVGNEFTGVGYPEDRDTGTMWQTTGDLSNVQTLYIETDTTDVAGGMSGGPWYWTNNDIVYATHKGHIPGVLNRHIRLTQGRFEHICETYMNHRCGLFYCAPRCYYLTNQGGCAGDECLSTCRNCVTGIPWWDYNGGQNNNCQCHNNGCNQCDPGYFKIDYDFPCQSCQDSFEHCLFCTDFYGCQQCQSGYSLVEDDTGCGDDSIHGPGTKIHYCI